MNPLGERRLVRRLHSFRKRFNLVKKSSPPPIHTVGRGEPLRLVLGFKETIHSLLLEARRSDLPPVEQARLLTPRRFHPRAVYPRVGG